MSTLKVVLHGAYDYGSQTRNVFWMYGDDAIIANGPAITDAIIDCILQDSQLLVDNYAYTGATLYDSFAPGVPGSHFLPSAGARAGANTGDPLPPQIALLLNFWAYEQRPNRKRVYLAGLSEAVVTAGLWHATQMARANAIVADIIDFATFSGMSITMGCAGPWGMNGSYVINDIDAGRAEQVPATQRRRRRGRGI
jgi:hypothetical protein